MINKNLSKLALRNVSHRGKRTWLTVIGVFIGIAAVVALVSLGQGLEQSIESEFESLGSDNLYIVGGDDLFQGFMASELEDRDVEVVKRARGVSDAGGSYFQFNTPIEFQGEESNAPILGIPTDESQEIVMNANALEVESGRELRSNDINNIVIGSNLQDSVFDNDVNLRSQITVNGEQFRVVGILGPTGDPEYDRGIFMDLDRSRDLFGAENELTQINAKVDEGFEPEEVAQRVEEEMRRDRGLAPGNENFQVLTAGQAVEAVSSILGIVQGVVIGLASISLLVGAVGILNTMYMSVTERTKEIGTMKAIGATNNQIRNLFLLESGLIGFIGGIIGIILGFTISEAASFGIRQFAEIPFSTAYSPTLIIGTLIFSFFIGALSGYLPAQKAYKLQPVEALRNE